MRNITLRIDGYSALEAAGAYIVSGGMDNIICFPPLKEPKRNDWGDENGIEVDLAEPRLASRECTLKCYMRDGVINALANIADGAVVRQFLFEELDLAYMFRIKSMSVEKYFDWGGLGNVSFRLVEDNPLDGYEYLEPVADMQIPSQQVLLPMWSSTNQEDTVVNASRYNCRVLDGTRIETSDLPSVKEPMVRSISTINGSEVDGVQNFFKERTHKIQMLMRATTFANLWRNWFALLYSLTTPELKEFGAYGYTFNAYYKSCTVDEFSPFDKWIKFTLTIVETNPW